MIFFFAVIYYYITSRPQIVLITDMKLCRYLEGILNIMYILVYKDSYIYFFALFFYILQTQEKQ